MINNTALVLETYTILELDEEGRIDNEEDEGAHVYVDQYEDEILEVWKKREDGFYFVFSSRLEIGYWVSSNLVTIKE